MTRGLTIAALGGLVLSLSACVVAPPPAPMTAVQDCRQFTQTITVNGKQQTGYGVQCPMADGTWHVVVPPQATPPQASAVVPPTGYAYTPGYEAYPYTYPYTGVYGWPYSYYYGPDVTFGFGWGWGWGGGWHGGWGNRWHGWHDGGWHGGGGHGGRH